MRVEQNPADAALIQNALKRKELTMAKDLTGQVFGAWIVTEKDHPINGKPRWKVTCACGTKASVRQDSLLSGKTKSCGCGTKASPILTKALKAGTVGATTSYSEEAAYIPGTPEYKRKLWGIELRRNYMRAYPPKDPTSPAYLAMVKKVRDYDERMTGVDESRTDLIPGQDLTGEVFWSLSILGRDTFLDGKPHWKAVCCCGGVCSIREDELLKGNARSCGCNPRPFAA